MLPARLQSKSSLHTAGRSEAGRFSLADVVEAASWGGSRPLCWPRAVQGDSPGQLEGLKDPAWQQHAVTHRVGAIS